MNIQDAVTWAIDNAHTPQDILSWEVYGELFHDEDQAQLFSNLISLLSYTFTQDEDTRNAALAELIRQTV